MGIGDAEMLFAFCCLLHVPQRKGNSVRFRTGSHPTTDGDGSHGGSSSDVRYIIRYGIFTLS